MTNLKKIFRQHCWHFGFCYGVENAIEISFKTIEENPGKNIYLLSEMIHNPLVNDDLTKRGLKFLMDTKGNTLVPFTSLCRGDVVIIPAFGTTLEIEKYNTTCPFVEKVWNRAEAIAKNKYSIVVHGKPHHEETRATFSHSAANSPTVVVTDMSETIELARYITGEKSLENFYLEFAGKFSNGFNIENDLQRIGVVNQTTMLASDTQAIADYLKNVMIATYNLTEDNIAERFADTRDTLCYATYENQSAVYGLLQTNADLAIIVGGYNSSNTSHLVELCEEKFPSYFIKSSDEIISSKQIQHFNLHKNEVVTTLSFLPEKNCVKILLTSGASCPDAEVENVIKKLVSFYNTQKDINEVANEFMVS